MTMRKAMTMWKAMTMRKAMSRARGQEFQKSHRLPEQTATPDRTPASPSQFRGHRRFESLEVVSMQGRRRECATRR